MKEEYALNISEDNLFAEVMKKELPVGGTKQTIFVGEGQISDFKVEEQKAELRGSRQTYRCSYTVNKSKTVLAVSGTGTQGNGAYAQRAGGAS